MQLAPIFPVKCRPAGDATRPLARTSGLRPKTHQLPGSLKLGVTFIAGVTKIKLPRHPRRNAWRARRVRRAAKIETVETVETGVKKPPHDPRSYRVVRLPNDLEVFLASDPEADMAAAALSVRCGCFNDPASTLGLAHLHEHMLFLGSEKYPEEDEYCRFLGEHAGGSNAYTEEEFTCYYFSVNADFLEGALDRFSQLFLAPRFEVSSLEREIQAVDAENTNYSTDDVWRGVMLHKMTVDEDHPFARFDVGTFETLHGDAPRQTREELLRWNQQHYTADRMKVVIVGSQSLEELQNLAMRFFSAVRTSQRDVKPPSVPSPLPWASLGRVLRRIPVKDIRSIMACWPLPPSSEHLFTKPVQYLSHFLGHEGEGSLHSILNANGWVDDLIAGAEYEFENQQLFALNIILTPEGDEHQEEILGLLYRYISLIRAAGPQQEVFQEIRRLQEIAFAYKEDEPEADDFAEKVAMALHRYSPEEALRGPFALDDWQPDVIQRYLDLLVPERCLIFSTSPSFTTTAEWQHEKWYGTTFREDAFSPGDLPGDSGLELPALNPFVPQDLQLFARTSGTRFPAEATMPTLLSEPEMEMMEIWYKMDRSFGLPRANVMVRALTNSYRLGPDSVVMMRLFCAMVDDDLSSTLYDAQLAGLDYKIEFSDHLQFSVSGFHDKLPRLLTVLVERFEEMYLEVQEAKDASEDAMELLDRLDTQRQILLQEYENFTREEPLIIAEYFLSQVLSRDAWNFQDYLPVLRRPISLVQLGSALQIALQEVKIQALVHGNIEEHVAVACTEVLQKIPGDVLQKVWQQETIELPPQSTVFQMDLDENPQQKNSCTTNFYQVGSASDLRHEAQLLFLCHAAEPSAFQRLRTELQLGYNVEARHWCENNISGLCIAVQGCRLSPREVDRCIEEWLQIFQQKMETMTNEEFQRQLAAVSSSYNRRYTRLSQETRQHWREIRQSKHFHRVSGLAAEFSTLTQPEIQEFFKSYLAAGGSLRKKLSIRVLGSEAERGEHQLDGDARYLLSLSELKDFRQSAEVFAPKSKRVSSRNDRVHDHQ